MELTLAKRERIERALLILAESKSRKARRERLRYRMFVATIAMSILFVVAVVWMICESGWMPGDQSEIYRAYKAQRHEAELFSAPATGEVVSR